MADWTADVVDAVVHDDKVLELSDDEGDWDASSEEEVEKVTAKVENVVIKEEVDPRREEERRLARERADMIRQETPDQRKARLKKEIEDAEQSLSKDVFGGASDSEDDEVYTRRERIEDPAMMAATSKLPAVSTTVVAGVAGYKLKTMEDFKNLAKDVGTKVAGSVSKRSEHAFAIAFLKDVIQEVSTKLSAEELADISSALTVLRNKKQKEKKPAKKGGKKKVQLKVSHRDAFDDLF